MPVCDSSQVKNCVLLSGRPVRLCFYHGIINRTQFGIRQYAYTLFIYNQNRTDSKALDNFDNPNSRKKSFAAGYISG